VYVARWPMIIIKQFSRVPSALTSHTIYIVWLPTCVRFYIIILLLLLLLLLLRQFNKTTPLRALFSQENVVRKPNMFVYRAIHQTCSPHFSSSTVQLFKIWFLECLINIIFEYHISNSWDFLHYFKECPVKIKTCFSNDKPTF